MKKWYGAFLVSALIGGVLGIAAAWWGIPYAYAERGYFAVGGEWLLILAAAFLPFLCNPRLWNSR